MNIGTAEFYDILIGLYNYDMGDTDNGINNPQLKADIIDHINAYTAYNFRIIMSRLVRDHFLSENALFFEGRGIADAASFIDWLRTEMGITL